MSESKVPSKESYESYQSYVTEFDFNKEYPFIDKEGALSICGDWSFIYELLLDLIKESQEKELIVNMERAIQEKNYEKYHLNAHSIKGAASNLHLPGLATSTKAAEAAGKLLKNFKESELPNYSTLIENLPKYVEYIKYEFQRIEEYLPTAQALAANGEEGEGEGEEGEEGEEYEDGEEEYEDGEEEQQG